MSIDLRQSYSSSSYDPSSNIVYAKRADEIARELIERSAKKASNVSFVYKEMLRSVINSFSNFVVVDPEDKVIDVQCIHGTQERAIAKLTQDTNIILPIISVDQPKSNRDEKRQRYKPLVVSEKYTDPKTKRNHRLVSLVPSPVEIEYEVTIWAKYKNDLDQITEQIHANFNPDLELTTIFGTNIKLFLKEEATESNTIAADREDRLLKRSFKLLSSTYIPSPKFLMTSTGQIEDFNFEYEIEETTEIQSINHLRTSSSESGGDSGGGGGGGGGDLTIGDASSIRTYPVYTPFTSGASLVFYGSYWAASDTFIKETDIAELRAKVDSVDWGARNYKPDFIKLAYASEYGSGDTGSEIGGQSGSELWNATSSFGEIGRWFIPENSFRGQGILEIDVMGHFDASVQPTIENKTLVESYSLLSSIFFSGINSNVVPSSYTLVSTLLTGGGDWTNTNVVSGTRVRRVVNGQGTLSVNGANYSILSITSSTPYILAGCVVTDPYQSPTRKSVVFTTKNRALSALNQNSYFTVQSKVTGDITSSSIPYSSLNQYSIVSGSTDTNAILQTTSSIHAIYKYDAVTPSNAVITTSAGPFSGLAEGDFLVFYKNDAVFSSLSPTAVPTDSFLFSIPFSVDNIFAASDLDYRLNAEAGFTALNLSATTQAGKLVIFYTGTTDNYEFGVLGDAGSKLNIQPSANTYYAYSQYTKQEYFDFSPNSAYYGPSLASAVGVFELQIADDPLDDTLDYSDLPYGVEVSTLGYTVYDQSGFAFAGNVNTSTLFGITYQPPASAVGVPGSATFGFPQPWTTIASFEAVSSFINRYDQRNDFNINIKIRSGHSEGSTRYQPYTIEINQANASEIIKIPYIDTFGNAGYTFIESQPAFVNQKITNRTSFDVTKDKLMRIRYKCIPYSNTGTVVYYTDINGPYVEKTVGATTYYYKVVPRIFTVTTLAATLTCPGDGHPF